MKRKNVQSIEKKLCWLASGDRVVTGGCGFFAPMAGAVDLVAARGKRHRVGIWNAQHLCHGSAAVGVPAFGVCNRNAKGLADIAAVFVEKIFAAERARVRGYTYACGIILAVFGMGS